MAPSLSIPRLVEWLQNSLERSEVPESEEESSRSAISGH